MTQAPQEPVRTATEIAVTALIQALDNSPRHRWPKVIEMALNAVYQRGYAQGYKTGAATIETVQEKLAIVTERLEKAEAMVPPPSFPPRPGTPESVAQGYETTPAPAIAEPAGEDKSLSNEVADPDEELVDVGYQFLREIAKQFGLIAKQSGATPDTLQVQGHDVGDGVQIAIVMNLRKPTERKA